MNLQNMPTRKLRSILVEIQIGGMGMKDIMFLREIENELLQRGAL
jgi:hypothetical protein